MYICIVICICVSSIASFGFQSLSAGQEKGIDSYIGQLLDSLGLSQCCDRPGRPSGSAQWG